MAKQNYYLHGYSRLLTWLTVTLTCLVQAAAQVTGIVIDSKTRQPLEYVDIYYDGKGYGVQSDEDGKFILREDSAWRELTIHTMGYERMVIKLQPFGQNKDLKVRLKPEGTTMREVTVSRTRTRYSRKNNPAVELMRKVIAHKRMNDLHAKDFFTYTSYDKMTFSINEFTEKIFEMEEGKAWAFLKEHVERHPKTGKLILPLTVDEQLSHTFYRKHPRTEKELIKAKNSRGINELINTGEIINTILHDCFTDVNIYDEECRLLQLHFKSPIANSAISFYRYYIQDTLYFDRSTPEIRASREYNPLDFYITKDDALKAHPLPIPVEGNKTPAKKQLQLQDSILHKYYESVIVMGFTPNNQQDVAFSGLLYILNDSTYQVKSAELNVPKQSNVNFIENIRIDQYYEDLPTSERVCVQSDMLVEMAVTSWLSKLLVQRTVRNFDYQFDEIPQNVFKRIKGTTFTEPDATMHTDDQYWAQYRKVELSKSESQIGGLLKRLTQMKGFKPVMIGVKALIENYVETSDSTATNKFDFGPINTTVSYNDYDRWRFRLSGFTTAHLHPHLFLSGYIAYGTASHNLYGWGEMVYSFNKKAYLSREFPKNNIHVSYRRDVTTPFDKFVPTDKDNMFMAFHTSKVDQYNLIREWKMMYDREWYNGAKAVMKYTRTQQRPVDELFYQRLGTDATVMAMRDMSRLSEANSLQNRVSGICTSEFYASVSFEPGATYINTKQRRVKINKDAPIFTVSHTLGLKDFLGGDYNYNVTEAGIYKRFYIPSGWGYTDFDIRAGIQWNKVPFPLLIHPAVNQSYVMQDNTFSLINSLEFLNDRYAQVMWGWDICGKIFNRVPLLKKLHWREFIGVNALWGTLSDKNNPFVGGYSDSDLFFFPGHFRVDAAGNPYYENNTVVMDQNTPYVELRLGIHNIFKILHVDYVRRLTYLNNPGTNKHGIRFMFRVFF